MRGAGRFLDDLAPARHLAVAFVRSLHAHAGIRAIDTARARARPGVVAVLTAEELRGQVRPLAPSVEGGGFTATAWPILADGEVRYGGQPVAMILAESAHVAADAREDVRVEYEPRPATAALPVEPAGEILFRRAGATGDVEEALPAPRSSCARRSATPAAPHRPWSRAA